MSEEEILEIILEMQCNYKEILKDDDYNDYTKYSTSRYNNAIQGLLDLYNKEKEKNIELETKIAKRQWVKVKENGEVEPLFYINKDKIKHKIKILEKLLNETKNEKAKKNLETKIITLKELLEE